MKLVTVQEMVAIEKAADAAGHSYQAMMEAAGKGLAEVIRSRYAALPAHTVSALVGSGNNGGDALVALEHLQSWGWKTTALICRTRPPADQLVQRLHSAGGKVVDWSGAGWEQAEIAGELGSAELILDGILGTGIQLPLRDPLKSLLVGVKRWLSLSDPKPIVVAVDCPSGVDCDSGAADPACLEADLTVTMAAVKRGLLEFPAYKFVGELCLVEIGLPENFPELLNVKRELITSEWVDGVLPQRPPSAHKGTFGKLLIAAGSQNYAGAALLAAESAYRAGVGLVTLAVPGAIYAGLIGALPEATWLKVNDSSECITAEAITRIGPALEQASACLIGPGLGLDPATASFLAELLQKGSLPPLILDADALRLAREIKGWPDIIPPGSILTPHPGEMSALTGLSIAEVEADRLGVAERYSREWDQVVILKGAHTLISDPRGVTKVYLGGEPALARAGSGDVLAGIVAGLVAQGVPRSDAAAAGVWIHGQAGRLAAKRLGSQAAVLAGDIADAVGQVIPR